MTTCINRVERNKKPLEIIPLRADFYDSLDDTELITSVVVVEIDIATGIAPVVSVLDGIYQIQTGVQAASKVVQRVKLGSVGDQYKITIKATTDAANTFEFDFLVNIIATSADNAENIKKQPAEIYAIAAEYARQLEDDELITSASVTAVELPGGGDVSAIILEGVAVIQEGDQSSSEVAQKIKAGVDATQYQIGILATTDSGHKYQMDYILLIAEL